jgi:hypothetical protein
MIYVWDNGLFDSDHRLLFVDVPGEKRSEAERLAKIVAAAPRAYRKRSGFTGLFEVVEWRTGKPLAYADWVADMLFTLEAAGDVPREGESIDEFLSRLEKRTKGAGRAE